MSGKRGRHLSKGEERMNETVGHGADLTFHALTPNRWPDFETLWSQRLPRFVASCGNSCRYESLGNYGFFRKETPSARTASTQTKKSATFRRRSFP